MMTKSERRIMNFFVSRITKKFSLNGAGREIRMHQALFYRSSRKLVKRRFIIADENGLFGLNYKENHTRLVASEYERASEFISEGRHKKFARFVKEFIDGIDENRFIFLLFGSAVEKTDPRDYDVLVLMDSIKKATTYEKILRNIAENYPTLNIDVNVDLFRDFRQMLMNRNDENVVNKTLNKHLIFYGAEFFYRMLGKTRPYDA